MSVLHHFIERENNLQMLRELLRRGANPNRQDELGRTPLHFVVLKAERNPQETDELLLVARELIRFRAKVNLGNDRKKTPLHYAVSCRNLQMIEMLLESHADINATDDEGYTPLHYASSKRLFPGHNFYDTEVDVVKLLLKQKPELDVQGRNKETALIYAAQNNDIKILRVLLQHDVSARLQDIRGNTALHYALNPSEVDVDVVLELMRHGASFNTINNSSESPISIYLRRLVTAAPAELEKAKFVLKLYEFYTNGFNNHQKSLLVFISVTKNVPLRRFVKLCHREMDQMHRDKLSPNYTVRDIAVEGAYCKSLTNIDHFPIEICDKVLDTLIRGRYPIYRDLIVAAVCNPYLRIKFATMCSLIKTKRKIMNYDMLYKVSYYLSGVDMLNMMTACSWGFKRHWYLPRFTYNTRCSMS